jgi:adhesin transport system outer membrane protein
MKRIKRLSSLIALSLVISWCYDVSANGTIKTEKLGEKAKQDGKTATTAKLTLEKTIKAVLATNPEILVKKAEQRAAEHRVEQEAGLYLPKIDLNAGFGYENYYQNIKPNKIVPTVTSTTGTIVNDTDNRGINLTQRLFDGFETANRVDKARKEACQWTESAREAMLLLSFQGSEQYIAVRRFERLLKIAKENIVKHQEILAKIKSQVNAGQATVSDEHLVQGRLDDALAAAADISGDLNSAIGNFIQIVGIEPKNTVPVVIDQSKLPKSLDDAIKIAIANNRSVKVALASVEVVKADLEVTTAPFLPAVDLQMQANRKRDMQGELGSIRDMTAMLVARFNLFNGGRDLAKRREYIERVNIAKHKIEQEKRRAEKEVRVSYAEWVSASMQAATLQTASNAKKKVVDSYLGQFNAGRRSFIDILDASHEYFLAKGSLYTAQATMDHAAIRLMTAINRFFDLFGVGESDQCLTETPCAVEKPGY